jgi:uncharacterized protein
VVVSYKRSGEAVPTPVWFGLADDGRVYFRTDPNSGKVKRIRNDPRVRMAPCNTRGKPVGPSAKGQGRILPEEEFARAEPVIQSNYGLGRRIYDGVVARIVDSAYVEISPAR